MHVTSSISTSLRVSKNFFAGDHFELDKNEIISMVFLASLGQNTDVQCIDFHRTLSEGQEIDIRSKLLLRVSFENL